MVVDGSASSTDALEIDGSTGSTDALAGCQHRSAGAADPVDVDRSASSTDALEINGCAGSAHALDVRFQFLA